jgi:hypothetical protein
MNQSNFFSKALQGDHSSIIWGGSAANNAEKKVFVARDAELWVSGEVIFIPCLIQQSPEEWVIEDPYFDHKPLAILTHIDY